jgi:hypothetical protein
MTTMRAMRVPGTPGRTNGMVALWLAAMAAGVGLLYAPFAYGDRTLMQWTWPIGAALLFLAVRGLGTAVSKELGERERPTREDAVGRWLERLGGRAHVLRYVDAGGRSIEYVVVAPSGVFAIRTRGHRGKVTARGGEIVLNGRSLPPDVLATSRTDVTALEGRLSALGFAYPVRSLIVFTEAHTDVRSFSDVTVLPLRWLESFIRQSPGVMSQLESTVVAGALKRDARATSTR